MSEHDDLDRQFVLFAPAKLEQLEYPNQVPRAAIVALVHPRISCMNIEN